VRGPQEPEVGTETVLLVEDEQLVRDLTRELLEEQGYRVFAAATGLEALRLWEEHGDVDVVVTDTVMPEMGGRELEQRLRAVGASVPFVFTSGYPGDDGLATGVGSFFVQKPYSAATLGGTVRRALATRV
jgi:CheY-like chemotaxis protein